MRYLKWLVGFMCWWVAPFVYADPALLTALTIQPSMDDVRVLFTLSQKTLGHIKVMTNPDKVKVALLNTQKNFSVHYTPTPQALIQSIQVDQTGSTSVWMFGLNRGVDCQIQYVPSATQGSVVLQLMMRIKMPTIQPKTVPSIITKPKVVINPVVSLHKNRVSQSAQPMPLPMQPVPQKKIQKPNTIMIVIDPGHGGKDPGARGVDGTLEKTVVLNIAKQLADAINRTPHMRAILTRRRDYFISLRGRLAIARRAKANLFIAIHADAYFDHSATGASVYALSQHGATSEAAHWLAASENYSELGGVSFGTLKDHSPMVKSVLIDLAQTVTIEDSLRLGRILLDKLDNVTTLHYAHVEQAPFMVLKSPDIPSVLVETGFITNPYEEQRLSRADYQQKLAKAIKQAVSQYADRAAWS